MSIQRKLAIAILNDNVTKHANSHPKLDLRTDAQYRVDLHNVILNRPFYVVDYDLLTKTPFLRSGHADVSFPHDAFCLCMLLENGQALVHVVITDASSSFPSSDVWQACHVTTFDYGGSAWEQGRENLRITYRNNGTFDLALDRELSIEEMEHVQKNVYGTALVVNCLLGSINGKTIAVKENKVVWKK